MVLYRLKGFSEVPGKPAALRNASFDDESYPTCRELNEYLRNLVITGCVTCSSPHYGNYRLVEGVAVVWEKEYDRLSVDEKSFFRNVALTCLKDEFIDADSHCLFNQPVSGGRE
jgi:hypothetical protein